MIRIGEKTKLPANLKLYLVVRILGPMVLVVFLYLFLLMFFFSNFLFMSFLAILGAIILFIIFGWVCLIFFYKYTYIVVGEGNITFNSGVFVKRSKTISFDRVQNVETAMGRIAAFFDVSDIAVWTASPGQSAGDIPGHKPDGIFYLRSKDAEWLKNFILEKQK